MSPALVDTSVWRRYFAGRADRRTARALDALLDEEGAVLAHPAVVGELVLGGLSVREELLFARLPAVSEVSSRELLDFVRHRKLQRRGVGWVDCQLLASALIAQAKLWSLDRRLAEVAAELGVGFAPAP